MIVDDDGDRDDDGNTTNNGDANDDNATDYEVDKNEPPTMVKGKKSKAAITATKKAGAKTTGDDVIEVNTLRVKRPSIAMPQRTSQ